MKIKHIFVFYLSAISALLSASILCAPLFFAGKVYAESTSSIGVGSSLTSPKSFEAKITTNLNSFNNKALSIEGDYGNDSLRLGTTYGTYLNNQNMFKITYEILMDTYNYYTNEYTINRNLLDHISLDGNGYVSVTTTTTDFTLDSVKTKKKHSLRTFQQGIGTSFNHVIGSAFISDFEANTYFTQAFSKELDKGALLSGSVTSFTSAKVGLHSFANAILYLGGTYRTVYYSSSYGKDFYNALGVKVEYAQPLFLNLTLTPSLHYSKLNSNYSLELSSYLPIYDHTQYELLGTLEYDNDKLYQNKSFTTGITLKAYFGVDKHDVKKDLNYWTSIPSVKSSKSIVRLD